MNYHTPLTYSNTEFISFAYKTKRKNPPKTKGDKFMRRFKLPKLRHPWAKSAAGFTLVELIVVIAIMGVLAGVCTVGYSGYVKSANKKADKVLVGNIMRAIETGTNSTMFTPPASMSVGATTYPIGAIVLNTEGTKVLTTTSSKKDISGECVFSEPIEVTYIEYKTPVRVTCASCGRDTKESPQVPHTVTISYCTTHSNGTPSGLSNAKECNTNITGWTSKGGYKCLKGHNFAGTKETIVAGTTFTANFAQLYQASASGKCTLVENSGMNIATSPQDRVIEDTGALNDAIVAAYGSSANLALKYNGWGNVDSEDEAHEYATMYTQATGMMQDIQTLGAELGAMCTKKVGIISVGGTAISLGILGGAYGTGENYTAADGSDIVTSVAQAFMTEFGHDEAGKTKWTNTWNAAATASWTGHGFGLDAYGREYYSAMRKMYNNGFGSYLTTNGVDDKYVQVIKTFDREIAADNPKMQTLISTVGTAVDIPEKLPAMVNEKTFDDTSSGLKERFIAAKGTDSEEDAIKAFERCEKLFDTYKDSKAYQENRIAVYNTFVTVGENLGEATDADNAFGGNLYGYVTSYLQEMEALYARAQSEAGDGIVIMVTMENGVVKCDVSPSSANPRNDK